MHRLDLDAEVWREVPNGVDGRGQVAGRERCTSPVVDDDRVLPGEFVPLEDTISSFKAIADGKYDHVPEQAFYMVGGIEDVEKKAKDMERS